MNDNYMHVLRAKLYTQCEDIIIGLISLNSVSPKCAKSMNNRRRIIEIQYIEIMNETEVYKCSIKRECVDFLYNA